jgi:small-conductance mechanosensitive channel
MLKEVLDRLAVPPFDEIPEADAEALLKWVIPQTPIAIRRVAEGPRVGEYLFAPETVARAGEFYDRLRDYPYRVGATAGLYTAYLTTPGKGLELGWSAYLPDWSKGVFAKQTYWQWIALMVTALALTAALTPAIWLARGPSIAPGGEQVRRLRWRPSLVVAVAFGAAAIVAANWFIDDVVNLTGGPLVFVVYLLALLRYVAFGWLAALLVTHGAELVIRARGLESTAASATLIRLSSWVIIGLVLVGILVAAGQDFGFPVYSIVTGLGVGGIAIGFGAQSLVRDILSGVFFLIDDAFRMGEYIDVGAAKGRVEKISIRSLCLRHHRGALNTIPFGEIQTLTNYSRDWIIMKLPMRLTYDTDPQKVKTIIKQIGQEMAEDPDLGPMLLEPPKSQGVLQMEDSAMILRVKFMAKPGEQFVLRRELLHRIRAAFEQEGIQFASREVTVHVTGDADDGKTKKAAAAAARRALDDEAEQKQDAAAEAGGTR